MNNTSRTLIVTFFVFFLLFTGLAGAATSPESTCKEKHIIFGFFNGVKTHPAQAWSSLLELRKIHGDYNLRGEKIKYRTFYNSTLGFADFVETFEQRAEEQNGVLKGRYELFFDAINGGGGSWWSSILKVLPNQQAVLEAMPSAQAIAAQLLAAQKTNTELNYSFHKDTIDAAVKTGTKLLFVAHSQGNLFANAAYKYAITAITKNGIKQSFGDVYFSPESMIRMVHIAPASIETHGPVILADKDLVINGLRLLGGGVPSITDVIGGYFLRPAGINGERDFLGHGLLEIYINQKMPIAESVKSAIDSELNSLNPPPCGMEFLFQATITCDFVKYPYGQYSKTRHLLRAGYHHDVFGQIIVNIRAVGGLDDDAHFQVISGVPKSLTVTSDTMKPFPWHRRDAWVKYDFEKKSVTASFKYGKFFTDGYGIACTQTEPVLVWARSVEEVERTDYSSGSLITW